MISKSPFENIHVTAFRAGLKGFSDRLEAGLDTLDIKEGRRDLFKAAVLAYAKSGVLRKAPGETLLDKVTKGMRAPVLGFLRPDKGAIEDRNFDNRALMISLFMESPHFDPSALAHGKPQPQSFLTAHRDELELLHASVSELDDLWMDLAYTEEDFGAKTAVFREFENTCMGQVYDWQLEVETPFGEATAPRREPLHENGLSM